METQDIHQCQAIINNCTSALTRTLFDCRTALSATVMLLAIAGCFARNSMAQQSAASTAHGGNATQAVKRILIPAPLSSSLDSRKLKTGDEVILKTVANLFLQDGSTIPRGTRVVGHVTEAKARSKGDAQSSLAIAFDKLDLPDGETTAISGVIRAVGPGLSAASPAGGGVVYSGDIARTTYMPSVSADSRAVPLLNEQSVGVVGMKDLQLAADGALTSDSKSVKLESGTQVLLQVQLSAGG